MIVLAVTLKMVCHVSFKNLTLDFRQSSKYSYLFFTNLEVAAMEKNSVKSLDNFCISSILANHCFYETKSLTFYELAKCTFQALKPNNKEISMF